MKIGNKTKVIECNANDIFTSYYIGKEVEIIGDFGSDIFICKTQDDKEIVVFREELEDII